MERLPAGEVNRAELCELPFARARSGGLAIDEYQVLQMEEEVHHSTGVLRRSNQANSLSIDER
jgi:hypothetical protein